METWKDITGFNGVYQVGDHGHIKKGYRVIMGAITKTKPKYRRVILTKNGKRYSYLVHRLVASHFIRPPVNGEEVNHIDFDGLNNHVSNLEWTTSKGNSIHSRENYRKSKQGEKNPNSKISDEQAIKIKRLRKKGKTYKEIAAKFNLTVNDVGNITTRYYKHVDHLV